jgi:DNA (cytosine-5)-methyltransferase 1
LLTAGFPCQPFSSAGKKKGIRDSRGTLFRAIVDLLAARSPEYFVLENVKRLLTMERGAHFATILDALASLDYQVEWRLINALQFGLPQNRQRVFIVGSRADGIPDDRGPLVRLADVEELRISRVDPCLLAETRRWPAIENHGRSFATWGLARGGRFFSARIGPANLGGPALCLGSILEDDVGARFDFTESTIQRLEKSKLVGRFVDGVEILSNQGGGARMGYTVFGINGVAPTLTSTASRHYERYLVGERYRRLTNVEYARLQGFPDDHCSVVSVYDQYALFGNAVPPPMAEWALRRVVVEGVDPASLQRLGFQHRLFVDA